MAAVSGIALGNTCEWATISLLRDNIFELLFLKFTAPTCHWLMLYHRLVLPPIMCTQDASFLCPSEVYVNSSLL